MQEQSAENAPSRHVSLPLFLGVLFAPGLFVWLLLRNGHSGAVRAMGFSWAAVVLLAFVSIPSGLRVAPPSSAPTAEAQQQAPVPATSSSESADRELQQIAEYLAAGPHGGAQ